MTHLTWLKEARMLPFELAEAKILLDLVIQTNSNRAIKFVYKMFFACYGLLVKIYKAYLTLIMVNLVQLK